MLKSEFFFIKMENNINKFVNQSLISHKIQRLTRLLVLSILKIQDNTYDIQLCVTIQSSSINETIIKNALKNGDLHILTIDLLSIYVYLADECIQFLNV